jgi:hypothetical protein
MFTPIQATASALARRPKSSSAARGLQLLSRLRQRLLDATITLTSAPAEHHRIHWHDAFIAETEIMEPAWRHTCQCDDALPPGQWELPEVGFEHRVHHLRLVGQTCHLRG